MKHNFLLAFERFEIRQVLKYKHFCTT